MLAESYLLLRDMIGVRTNSTGTFSPRTQLTLGGLIERLDENPA
jgi:hypothetical protein